MTTCPPPDGELAARVRRIEDERAIADLLARYGLYADLGEHPEFVDLFTDDAVIELIGGTPGGAVGDHASWQGKERIREFIEDPEMHMKIEGRCMHLPALNLRIEIEGETATASSCSVVLVDSGGGPCLHGAGLTYWAFTRDHGQWRIRSRRRYAIGAAPSERVSA